MNRHLQTLLMPFDASGASNIALDLAISITRKTGCRLLFVHVSEPQKKAEDKLIQNLISKVNELKKAENINADFLVREGSVYKEISKTAESTKADLIVMGSHGLSGFQEFFAGSNAYKVATSAPCPVITVKEHVTHGNLEKILLPIDNSHYSRQKVNYISQLALQLQSSVHVVSISKKSESEHKQVEMYANQASEFLNSMQVPHTLSHIEGNNAYKMLLDEAQKVSANIIAIMTEQDIETPFMGAAAQQMIHHCPYPVISIKPKEMSISYAQL